MTGPDSRDAEQIIADVLKECLDPHAETDAPHVVAALRAAGLLPGPDTITVASLLRHALAVGQSAAYVHEVCETCFQIVELLEQP